MLGGRELLEAIVLGWTSLHVAHHLLAVSAAGKPMFSAFDILRSQTFRIFEQ